jgi:hypothetical protein
LAQTPIVLFPHTHVESRLLERLIDTFGSVTLCQPWFTEPTVLQNDFEKGTLKVCFPPEVLKPKEDFNRLLSEYQGWMMENQGKNRPATFSTGETGDATWTIRKAIRDAGKGADDPALKNTLKWHLVLHLARNLEAERVSAQDLLQRAAKSKSPLTEALEKDEEIPDMFEDLPLSATYPYVTDRHQGLIFEAWFGLFSSLIESNSELLTLDRQVFTYALDLFDGCDVQLLGEISPSEAKEIDAPGFTSNRKTFPKLLNPSVSTDSVLQTLSGKTLILVER